MLDFALNHMTVARASFLRLMDIAEQIGCVGVEVRNDLTQSLFDGIKPEQAGSMARERGLRLLTIAEVKRFNDWNDAKREEASKLIDIALAAGAEAVSLIPRNDNGGMGDDERRADLHVALREIRPMLEENGLIGLVEPLGFEICSLRYKSEAVDAIEVLGAASTFKLVHDTFHHQLAGGGPIFPSHTGMVHVSGVANRALSFAQMRDGHRVLVDAADRLGNVAQIRALREGGYRGPVSFEAFAPEVHESVDPAGDLSKSIEFIRSHLAETSR
jgi:2-keto-myo-inositol isomerase